MMRTISFVLALAVLGMLSGPALASYGFYVGRNLTADGSVLLGGTGEEPSSHWLEIVPRRQYAPGATVTVGATDEAHSPARLSGILQVGETFRYITMNYSSFAGFPAPLTNGGLNEHQVAVRDIWAPSRQELRDMTDPRQSGPQYSDLARLALERARSAREAVEIIGWLIDRHGYTTYGGNSHLIADPEEGWVVLQFAGSQGLWVAERLGPDDVRASYPGYIREIPVDYQAHPDFMGSDNLIDFAIGQGWYDPAAGEPFDVARVYGLGEQMHTRGLKYLAPAQLEEELEALAPVTVAELMALVRDPRIADDQAGYGQVAQLRRDLPHPELALLWVAPTGSVTAPFLPWWIGVQSVPPEYRQHRYLTAGAGSSFLNPDFQLQEASRFAGRVFKRLLYYTCADPARYLQRVHATLTGFEDGMLAEQAEIERSAAILYREDPALARGMLTRYSHARGREALALGESLVSGLEAEIHAARAIAQPPGPAPGEAGDSVNCLVGADPDRPR